MLAPAEAVADALRTEDRRDSVVVYADPDGETVLHQGPATIRANGWVELPSGRLLSPSAVHHFDRDP
ncbi:hypothetical protein BRC75_03230 [Halobacteriales archaeon QH_7_69_31]|nr:MAG: hypothetical protein BRC75_03230 [Halobacteriales archaeon QH_7_69_31]